MLLKDIIQNPTFQTIILRTESLKVHPKKLHHKLQEGTTKSNKFFLNLLYSSYTLYYQRILLLWNTVFLQNIPFFIAVNKDFKNCGINRPDLGDLQNTTF